MTESERRHAYYLANKHKWKAYRAASRKKHPSMDREIARRYYRKHRLEILGTRNTYLKQYQLKNKEKLKARSRDYYLRTKEARASKIAAYRALYKARNRDKIAESNRLYRIKNKEIRRIKKAEWRKNNPGKASAHTHKRRASFLKRNRTADSFIAHVKSMRSVDCYWCGKAISGKEAHIDHVIALSRGGNHCSSNLAASCPSCNLRKGAKLPTEWIKCGQSVLDI